MLPDAKSVPAGLNARFVTDSSCPISRANSVPVAASHNRISPRLHWLRSIYPLPEQLTEASTLPSGLNTTLKTLIGDEVASIDRTVPIHKSHNQTSPPIAAAS